MPEKASAVEYTIRQMRRLQVKKDYVHSFLQNLLQASQSSITKDASEATR